MPTGRRPWIRLVFLLGVGVGVFLGVVRRPSVSLPSPPSRPTQSVGAAETRRTFFSRRRSDRAGSVILDMLLAHAYAFQNQLHYGGACDESAPTNPSETHRSSTQELIQAMGLEQEIGFACPSPGSRAPIVDRRFYASLGTTVFTPAWRQQLLARIDIPPRNTTPRAVVHVRRGDIDPCHDPDGRYLPNEYFRQAVMLHVPPHYDSVTIHSESRSLAEPAADLAEALAARYKQVTLRLDETLPQAWRDMLEASVLVLSPSSFSMVPALLNPHGRVVYTHFWYEPLPHWVESRVHYQPELQKVRRQYCGEAGRGRNEPSDNDSHLPQGSRARRPTVAQEYRGNYTGYS